MSQQDGSGRPKEPTGSMAVVTPLSTRAHPAGRRPQPCSAADSGSARGWPILEGLDQANLDALHERGIDDLAKFRLVAFLCDYPMLWAPAEHFAHALGFHSVARTEVALDELVRCGIVRRRSPVGRHPRYGLAVSSDERAALEALCRPAPDSPSVRAFLSRLADRSLVRLIRERRSHPHPDDPVKAESVVVCGLERPVPEDR